MTDLKWSVSGLCVTARPEDLATVAKMLNERPGIEVHASDPESGRLIAVQECSTVREHQDSLRELQSLPGVLTADLVVHYTDPVDGQEPSATGGRE